jgi:hypothetical protein
MLRLRFRLRFGLRLRLIFILLPHPVKVIYLTKTCQKFYSSEINFFSSSRKLKMIALKASSKVDFRTSVSTPVGRVTHFFLLYPPKSPLTRCLSTWLNVHEIQTSSSVHTERFCLRHLFKETENRRVG